MCFHCLSHSIFYGATIVFQNIILYFQLTASDWNSENSICNNNIYENLNRNLI